jgi:hypothetical protein
MRLVREEEGCRFRQGTVLNERYVLLQLLGKGGFSEVYRVSLGGTINRGTAAPCGRAGACARRTA